ncbi:MAG: hypothetical protein J6M07_10435 [Ruminococcus sp.]|nr:hypothetical protein [Ruminococcus sp.]
MDRKVCQKCRFSGYYGKSTNWTGCNYIIYTGEKRPHDGDICYGFEPMIGQTPQMKPVPVSADDCFRMWLNIMC